MPTLSYKEYVCMVCGHLQLIRTNHVGMVFDYCHKCSWKMYYSAKARKYSSQMFGHLYRQFRYKYLRKETYSNNPLTPQQAHYTVNIWFERDRGAIVVYNKNGKTIARWYDEEIQAMFED